MKQHANSAVLAIVALFVTCAAVGLADADTKARDRSGSSSAKTKKVTTKNGEVKVKSGATGMSRGKTGTNKNGLSNVHGNRLAIEAESPQDHAARMEVIAEADSILDRAREYIAVGRELHAINVLSDARAVLAKIGDGASRDVDKIAVDAYVLLRRDADAWSLLQQRKYDNSAWTGALPRKGLLLARTWHLADSRALGPGRYLVQNWGVGFGPDAESALPDLTTRRGIIAAWCLVIAGDERVFQHHPNIAARYYELALEAQPGQPLAQVAYGLLLEDQGSYDRALAYFESARPSVTGALRTLVECRLRAIQEHFQES
jgi:tetratricopeptide (TPR) repeat protein